MIVGNVVGCVVNVPDMVILQDEDGNRYPAVMVREETVFTATPNDVRQGTIAATEEGMITGKKIIPTYHTFRGSKLIQNGQPIKLTNLILNDYYDYTKLQSIICSYNTSLSNSVGAVMVSIEDEVYPVESVDAISSITKDHESKSIDYGLKNETGKPLIIRYIMYKEIE